MTEVQGSYSFLIVSMVPLRLPSNSIASITPTHFIKINTKVITHFVAEKGKNAGAYQMNFKRCDLQYLSKNTALIQIWQLQDSIYLLTVGPAIEEVTTSATKFTCETIAGPSSLVHQTVTMSLVIPDHFLIMFFFKFSHSVGNGHIESSSQVQMKPNVALKCPEGQKAQFSRSCMQYTFSIPNPFSA